MSIPLRMSEEDEQRHRQAFRDQISQHPYCIELTPAQQFALMQVRQGELSKAIVEKLMHSTVRPAPSDYLALINMGLIRKTPRWYALTPRGLHRAGIVARELADCLGIRIKTKYVTPGVYQRQHYVHSSTW